jgi:uncharacterized protein (DUF1015 family)
MAVIRPFQAIRPDPSVAPRVAAVPYDVVDADEAQALAAGNPLSFLHVSRAEIDLPGIGAYDDRVYRAAADRYRWLKHEAPLRSENEPALYLYHLEADGHGQTGVAACFSVDEYDRDVIKKHERTRRDKEDDRTRHITELRAQSGPVFLVHRSNESIDAVTRRVRASADPVIDFEALDGVRHAIWRVGSNDALTLIDAFGSIATLYIADGHHRAASAARAREVVKDSAEAGWFLAVAFPSDHVRILPYNRVVRDLNGMTREDFLGEISRRFAITAGPAVPEEKGQVAMYLDGVWRTIDLGASGVPATTAIEALDAHMLQEGILRPLLGIHDVRTDKRIDFVGGAKGTGALEQLVDAGKAAAAFSMYPVSVTELMAVSDAGEIMPPKSTWFEPKLRDGLLIHEI